MSEKSDSRGHEMSGSGPWKDSNRGCPADEEDHLGDHQCQVAVQ